MHVAQAVLLAHAAVERLVLGVRMDVDQPRQHQTILAVDDPVRRPRVIPPDKIDAIVGKGDIDAAPVDLARDAFVPGDDPVGVFDDGGCHGASSPALAR